MYELVLDKSGDYISLSGNSYKGTFTTDSLSQMERNDLREAAQNLVEFHFLEHGKVIHKVISRITGSEGLETMVFDEEI